MKRLVLIATLCALSSGLVGGCVQTFEARHTPNSTYTLTAYSDGRSVGSWQTKEYHTGDGCIYFQELKGNKYVFISDEMDFTSVEN